MKVLGLLLTLSPDSQFGTLERTLRNLPGLSLGDRYKSHLAAVLEGDTTTDIDRQLDAIAQSPGVALVQVVSAYWDEPDGDGAHRLRGKHRRSRDEQTIRADVTCEALHASLNGESR